MMTVKIENQLGEIHISQAFLERIIGDMAMDCFGVSGLAKTPPPKGIKALLPHQPSESGIWVQQEGKALTITLHIMVIYGVHISGTVRNVINRVRTAVEQATGLYVAKVSVSVDGIRKA